jgi:hypothetical protein
MVEIMVAIGVFAVVAMMVASMMAGGLKGVLQGKRREVATEEANKTLEIARSLSYNQIGLVATDPTLTTANDPKVVTNACCGAQKGFQVASGQWEPLVFATNPIGHLFNPHKVDVSRGSVDLTRYVYVTSFDSDADGTNDLKRVTVRVVWRNTGTEGPENEIKAQTFMSQSGVVTLQGGGGGLTPLTGNAFGSGGGLKVTSSLLGLTSPLDVSFPTSTGDSTFRAISDTNCTTRSAGLNALNLVDLPPASVSVTADDDASSATPSSPAAQNDAGTLNIPLGVVRNLVGAVVNSPVSCQATADPLADELGTGSSLGTVTAQTNVLGLGGLLNWLLTIASVQSSPVTQNITHQMVGGQREVASSASSAVGQVQLLKIPAIANGLVQVDALTFSAAVRGAEGTPSAAPVITAPQFTIRVFDNGTKLGVCSSRSGSYCIINVNPTTPGFTGLSFSVTHNFTQLLGLNLVNIGYTTNVDILPPAKSPLAGVTGPNGEKRWSAEYTPISITANLTTSALGIPLIDATVDLNLGSVKAEACSGVTCL